jgi:hypothetical protein
VTSGRSPLSKGGQAAALHQFPSIEHFRLPPKLLGSIPVIAGIAEARVRPRRDPSQIMLWAQMVAVQKAKAKIPAADSGRDFHEE